MRWRAETVIAAPRAAVWRVLLDLGRAPEYVPFLVRAEPHDGAAALGSRVRMTFEAAGRRATTEAVVTKFEPPSALTIRAEVDEVPMTVEICWSLAPAGGQGSTGVELDVAASFGSLMARMAAAAMSGKAEEQQAHALDRLRLLVERELGDGADEASGRGG